MNLFPSTSRILHIDLEILKGLFAFLFVQFLRGLQQLPSVALNLGEKLDGRRRYLSRLLFSEVEHVVAVLYDGLEVCLAIGGSGWWRDRSLVTGSLRALARYGQCNAVFVWELEVGVLTGAVRAIHFQRALKKIGRWYRAVQTLIRGKKVLVKTCRWNVQISSAGS